MMLPQFPALGAHWREELARESQAIIFCWATWSPTDFQLGVVLARVIPDLGATSFFTADLDVPVLWPLFAEGGVSTNPCLMLWQGGVFVQKSAGYMNEEQLRARFKEWNAL